MNVLGKIMVALGLGMLTAGEFSSRIEGQIPESWMRNIPAAIVVRVCGGTEAVCSSKVYTGDTTVENLLVASSDVDNAVLAGITNIRHHVLGELGCLPGQRDADNQQNVWSFCATEGRRHCGVAARLRQFTTDAPRGKTSIR